MGNMRKPKQRTEIPVQSRSASREKDTKSRSQNDTQRPRHRGGFSCVCRWLCTVFFLLIGIAYVATVVNNQDGDPTATLRNPTNRVMQYFQELQALEPPKFDQDISEEVRYTHCALSETQAWKQWSAILSQAQSVVNAYEVFDRPQQCFQFHRILLHKAQPVDVTKEWVAVVRTQKTASKTVTQILKWMSVDNHFGESESRSVCDASFFGISSVPLAQELENNRRTMPEEELLENPYQQRLDFAKRYVDDSTDYWTAVERYGGDSIVLNNQWIRGKTLDGLKPIPLHTAPDTLFPTYDKERVKRWYKGAELKEYDVKRTSPHREKPKGCNGFDVPHKIVPNSKKCKFLYEQHMHIGDIFGAIWETMVVPPKSVRIVTALRHPVRRVLSEYKHLGVRGSSLWDYCHHPDFDDLGVSWKTGNQKFGNDDKGRNYFKQFMMNHYHAYGMRNRQVKMISGLVTEPEIPSLLKSKLVWKSIVSSLMDQQGQKTYTPANISQSVLPPGDPYYEWGLSALQQAQHQILQSSGVVLLERLPESIAVLLYSFDWRPKVLLQDKKVCFPMSRITQDPLLFGSFTDVNSTKRACENSIKVDSKSFGQNMRDMKPSTYDSEKVIKGSEVDTVSPSSEAWTRLLHISKEIGDQLSKREGVDLEKIRFDIDESLFKDILTLNHWDASLFYWADKLLTARVSLIKSEFAKLEREATKRT